MYYYYPAGYKAVYTGWWGGERMPTQPTARACLSTCMKPPPLGFGGLRRRGQVYPDYVADMTVEQAAVVRPRDDNFYFGRLNLVRSKV
jgi:hypothetical protein